MAEGRYPSDELTIHYGLVPRTNRGVVAINELPDLPERIQVALFNILEERDVQIRGYTVSLPLDLTLIASANPEDYTHRGRIVSPLKDRFGSQIRTHYPESVTDEMAIMDQEATPAPEGVAVKIPQFVKEVVAEMAAQLRTSPMINQRSGVSVRFSIGALEMLAASALRRAGRNGEDTAVQRVSDLWAILPELIGRIEFEALEEGRETEIMGRALRHALLEVWRRRAAGRDYTEVVAAFDAGNHVELSDATRAAPGPRSNTPRTTAGSPRVQVGCRWSRGFRDGKCTGVLPRGPASHKASQLALDLTYWVALQRRRDMRARYSRWDGTQDPLSEPLDIFEVLDELSDEILSGMDLDWVMRQIARRGISGRMSGLDSLARRLRAARTRAEEELNLSGPLAEVREALNEILSLERSELERLDDADAALRSAMLDALPDAPAAAVRELMHYDFASSQAEVGFDELLKQLRKDVLDSYFARLAGSLEDVTPQDLARLKDMLAELDAMIAARSRGEDVDFDGFMSRYGDFWPENPADLDELLEAMARRIGAMSRLLASMTPQQRRELSELARAVFDDLDLAFQIDQLADALRAVAPQLHWGEPVDADGEQAMPMSAAVDAIERATEYEDLERALADDYPGATLDDIDEDRLRRALGEDAVRDLQRLKEIEAALERAGILDRTRGKLKLTAHGARLMGNDRSRACSSASGETPHTGPGVDKPNPRVRPAHGNSDARIPYRYSEPCSTRSLAAVPAPDRACKRRTSK